MKWYDLLRSDKYEDVPHYASTSSDLDGFKWWHFAECKLIQDWRAKAWIKSISEAEDGPPDDGLANDDGLLIFSPRMRRALDAGGIVGIQYLSIRVLRSDNSVYEGYAIANILNCLAALDRDRSDYSVFAEDDSEPEDIGRISSLRKAVLKQEALRGCHIARLSDFPEAVYVSQHFVDIFKENALTGYSFSPVELVYLG